MQVIAYAYSPLIDDDASIISMEEGRSNPAYIELKAPKKDASPSSSHQTLRIDENFKLRGQTFLCMSSFYYQPKPVSEVVSAHLKNVIDFIEDIGLAGIRFVYFSSEKERESKGTCLQNLIP